VGSIGVVSEERARERRGQIGDRVRSERAGVELPPPGPGSGEVDRLAAAAKAGDAAAREQLIQCLLPLLVRIARGYRIEGLDFADLVQEAALGLLRALERYEPERGTPFTAYALWWVRQSLQELRSDFMRPLRLPPRALRQLAELKSEHSRFWAAESREPTLGELADRTGIERDQVDALVRADAGARLLSDPVGGPEGEVGVLGDMIEDPLSSDVYEELLDSIAGSQVRELLSRLSEREREIVDARFGFGVHEPERLVDIGGRLGLSTERVRQLEERALSKLRRAT
jgi:RNA polymerase primary sigma factor